MRILYTYGNCSDKKYKELFEGKGTLISPQAQKYHSLLTEGLAANGCEMKCISGLPVNRETTGRLYNKAESEHDGKLSYRYFASFNIPVLRRLSLLVKSFFYVLFHAKRGDVLIADILCVSTASGALVASRLRGLKTCGIVTDVPGYMVNDGRGSFIIRLNARMMRRFGRYVLLTEAMNSIVNPDGKPYIVLEGHVDASAQNTPEHAVKAHPKIMMYAGGLARIYGIGRLVNGFVKASPENWELHIYGRGDYEDELAEFCRSHPTVKHMGVRLNSEIVRLQREASLLVNPRPTNEEYVKYSFPSKNMESMASGTPLMTTRLPGMPDEYLKYVYIIDDESADGIAKAVTAVCNLTDTELERTGENARRFVLEKKSNTVQASKVVKFIKES